MQCSEKGSTQILQLPHQMDSARASFTGIIPVNELAKVGELSSDTEASRDHQDRCILPGWYTNPVRSAEQGQARYGVALIKRPMTEELTSQASPRLDEKF
jgi:hypothetical protein